MKIIKGSEISRVRLLGWNANAVEVHKGTPPHAEVYRLPSSELVKALQKATFAVETKKYVRFKYLKVLDGEPLKNRELELEPNK